MSKAAAKKEANELSADVLPVIEQDFGDITADDIEIGHIILIQEKIPKSLKEAGVTAQEGDFARMDSLDIIGGRHTPLEVLVLHQTKSYRLIDEHGQVLGSEDFVAGERPEKEAVSEEGVPCGRFLNYTFLMLPLYPSATPALMNMRKTKIGAAKSIITDYMEKARYAARQGNGYNSWHTVYTLFSVPTTDKRTNQDYIKLMAKASRKATPEEVAEAQEWYMQLAPKVKSDAEYEEKEGEHSQDDDLPF